MQNNPLCPACKGKETSKKFSKDGFNYFQCQNCAVYFYPVEGSLQKELYSKDYFQGSERGYKNYTAREKAIKKNAQRKISNLLSFKPKGSQLLEIGCAYGFFLKHARQYFNVTGIELSPHAAGVAQKNLGLPVINSDLLDANLQDDFFDIIVLWDTLEHIDKTYGTFKKINQIAKSEALLAFSTPDTSSLLARIQGKSWRHFDPPYHPNLFNKRGLEILLNNNGFRIIKTEKEGGWFQLSYLAHILAGYHQNRITKIIKKLFDNSRSEKMYIYLNFKDVITTYAIKQ